MHGNILYFNFRIVSTVPEVISIVVYRMHDQWLRAKPSVPMKYLCSYECGI